MLSGSSGWVVFVDHASEYSMASDGPGDWGGGGLVVVVGGALGERDRLGELCHDRCCGVGSSAEAGVPSVEVVGKLVVEDAGANLKEEVGAA